MATLKQYLQSEIDSLQMRVVKQANNIDEVKSLIDFFDKMNKVVSEAPEVSTTITAGSESTGKKRGRRKKEEVVAA
jgi:hypothetical protein